MRLEHNAQARELFAGIAPGYDRWAEVFSLFQYRRWHRALLAALDPQPGEHILDVSTGTGAVASDLAEHRCTVVGLDLSHEMLREATRRMADLDHHAPTMPVNIHFVEGRAEELPFPAASFDAVTFTFLLRYVADPQRPIAEIARVLRQGGRVAMLEFAIPEILVARLLWSLYVSGLLPRLTRTVSAGWAAAGIFLGRSIRDFYQVYPLPDVLSGWRRAGFGKVRCRRLSMGGAIVISGEKELTPVTHASCERISK